MLSYKRISLVVAVAVVVPIACSALDRPASDAADPATAAPAASEVPQSPAAGGDQVGSRQVVVQGVPEKQDPVKQDPVKQEPVKPVKQDPVNQAPEVAAPPTVGGQAGGQDPVGKGAPPASGQGAAAPGLAEGEAFPPTMPDIPSHADSWQIDNCLRCHETGVQSAPRIVHRGLPALALDVKCRTCHVFVPGSEPRSQAKPPGERTIEDDAFPPMIPASASHSSAWWKDDCLLCHEEGLRGAPRVVHLDLPRNLLTAKCRTCHVQVRAVDAEQRAERGH